MRIFDQYRTLQEQLARAADPLGLTRNREQERLFLSPMERIAGAFCSESLVAQMQRSVATFGAFDEIQRGLRGVTAIAELQKQFDVGRGLASALEATSAHRVIARAFETASSLSRLTTELAKIHETSKPLWEIANRSGLDVSRAFAKQFETARLLAERVSTWHVDAGARFAADLARAASPWQTAHQALWPNDSLLLRMLPGSPKVGAGSWVANTSDHSDAEAYVELAAMTVERVDAEPSITIELELCCALCGGPIFPKATQASWLAPRKMHLKIDVIPICETCSAREADEPGYMREALIELADGPVPVERPRLEIVDGDETDPVPRGVLRLVRDEEEQSDE